MSERQPREAILEQLQDLVDDIDCVPAETVQAVTLYLDPTGTEPRIHVAHGDGWPFAAHYGRWHKLLRVPPRTCGQDIVDTLVDCADTIARIHDAFEGEKFDHQRSNWIGLWDDDERHDADVTLDLALERDQEHAWRTYWDASEWLGDVGADLITAEIAEHKGDIEAWAAAAVAAQPRDTLIKAHELARAAQRKIEDDEEEAS